MRKVQRRYRPRTTQVHQRSTDFAGVESGVDTLMARFRAVKNGESLYPWSNTELRIANGKRRWVAKQPTNV